MATFIALQQTAGASDIYLVKDSKAPANKRYEALQKSTGAALGTFGTLLEIETWLRSMPAQAEPAAAVEVEVETVELETELETEVETEVETVEPEAVVIVAAPVDEWDAEIDDLLPDSADSAPVVPVAPVAPAKGSALRRRPQPATPAAVPVAPTAAPTAAVVPAEQPAKPAKTTRAKAAAQKTAEGYLVANVAKLDELENLASDVSEQGRKVIAQMLGTSLARLAKRLKAYEVMSAQDSVREAFLKGEISYSFVCETAIKKGGASLLLQAVGAEEAAA